MGFLNSGIGMGIGQGLNQGTTNAINLFLGKRQSDLERERFEQQKILQAAQIQEYQAQAAQREANLQRQKQMQDEYQAVLTPGGGMMQGGNPTDEDLNNILMKYNPKEAMENRVKLRTSGEAIRGRLDLQDVKNEALMKIQEEKQKSIAQGLHDKLEAQANLMREREDLRSQAMADKLDAKIKELEITYGLKRELLDAKKDDRTDKDQIALSRAQQMATRDLEKEYTHDTLTGQWLSNGVPVKQEVIARKYQQYVNKYVVGGGKGANKTNNDPLGIR